MKSQNKKDASKKQVNLDLNKAPLSPLKMNFPERLINFLHTFRSNYITAPLLHENFDQSVSSPL
jgi:capsule polysaccharide export protein KpsE/RkpR